MPVVVAASEVLRSRGLLSPGRPRTLSLEEATNDRGLAVVGIVLAAYVASVVIAVGVGDNASHFAFVGQEALDRSDTSVAIESNADAASPGPGYDGQFSLFIAEDPARAHAYMDNASYRYGRVLYPLAARASAKALGLGIPVTLLVLNILAVVGCVLALALWLRRRGCSAWPALLVGLFPGVYIAVFRDLTDVLAYSLVVAAVIVAERTNRRAVVVSAVIFALAVLTRETTLVFALIWAAALVVRGNSVRWRRGVLFASIALVPAFAYRGLLVGWLGDAGIPPELRPSLVPFGGFVGLWPWNLVEALQLLLVVVPGTLCGVVAVLAIRRGVRDPAVIAVAANAILYVVMLPEPVFSGFDSLLRAPLGVVVALVLAIPSLKETFGAYRLRMLLPAFAPIFAMTLLFAYYEVW